MRTCVTILLLSAIASAAWAGPPDNDPATSTLPRVIAYEGALAVDGTPLNMNDVAVRFYVCGTPDQAVDTCWNQQLNVAFHGGRFSVLLGENADPPLDPTIFDADDVYVRVKIGDTLLAGAQKIVPVPYALWSAHAADLEVAHDAHVAHNLVVDGTAQVGGESSFAGHVQFGAPGVSFPAAGGIQHATTVRGLWVGGPDPNNRGQPYIAAPNQNIGMTPVDTSICWVSEIDDSNNPALGQVACAAVIVPGDRQWRLVNIGNGVTACAGLCLSWN